MRRKSERTATKKAKPSPEKKATEKAKKTRTSRRRKQSTSSEESADETSPVREAEATQATPVEQEQKPPQTPTKEKEVSPDDAHEVWHVKTAEAPSDTGEIQKLKICLTRPPSTPERVDRSPRSRRKHSRATSSSDTTSVEAVEDRKKSKHRSKHSARESKDESEKNQDSQGDEADSETPPEPKSRKISQSSGVVGDTVPDETPMSTTSDDKVIESENPTASGQSQTGTHSKDSDIEGKTSDADTTVASPQAEVKGNQSEDSKQCDKNSSPKNESQEKLQSSQESEKADERKVTTQSTESKAEKTESQEQSDGSQEKEETPSEHEVSKSEDNSNNSKTEEAESSQNESSKATNDNDVVDSSENVEKKQRQSASPEPVKERRVEHSTERNNRDLEHSDSTQSHEEPIQNGQGAPIVVSRKRRWGSRSSKLTTQKSITISTDVLKDIIPDVKPVEFEEVIEEKKQHKRVQSNDKVERPVLPKIVIDNTDHLEHHKKEYEEREPEKLKYREPLSANRRISIVKDDSIIARPPSPPRNKQSCILYITNLVRPFTLPQLKNLLQRTGRISEDGFWIDRIKSRCFVKYEIEDQAVETRHALHGVTWPVSNPKTLQVDFSSQEAFDKAKANEDTDNAQATTIPGTVEDWLREQDMKREREEMDKPWERKAAAVREWDFGKNEKDKDKERPKRDERILDKRRHRTAERSPEPAKKFKKKEEEAPAKLLDDLFRKTKSTPCIYWLPLSAEMIAIKEEQRRQHMAEHERRMQELRRTHRRH